MITTSFYCIINDWRSVFGANNVCPERVSTSRSCSIFRLLNSIWCLADVTDGTLETTNRIDHRFGLALVVIAMVSCGFLLIEYGGENWSKDHQCHLPLNFRDHVEITQRRRFIRRFNKWRANSGREQWKVCIISSNLCTTSREFWHQKHNCRSIYNVICLH